MSTNHNIRTKIGTLIQQTFITNMIGTDYKEDTLYTDHTVSQKDVLKNLAYKAAELFHAFAPIPTLR